MPIFAAGASLVGGIFSGNAAANASRAQADAQRYAADKAAEEARFRPVGVSGSRYGTTSSQYDPATGRVSGMSYALTPEMQAYQDRFQRLAGQGLTDAEQARGMFDPLRTAGQQLFGMGQRYLDQPQDQRIGNMAGGYLGPSQIGQRTTELGNRFLDQPPGTQFSDMAQPYLQPSQYAADIGRVGSAAFNQQDDPRFAQLGAGYLQPSQVSGDISRLGGSLINQQDDQRFAELGAGYLQPSQGSQALTQLGQSYIGQNPQDVEQQYMKRQMALLAPGREQESANLQNQLFQQGRGGLSVGATSTGMGATTPELQAMYNARAQQDAVLAANAQQAGQQSAAFGAGLLGQGQQLGMAGQQFGMGAIQAGQGINLARQQAGAGFAGQGQQLGMAGQQFGMGAIQAGQGFNQQRQQFGLGAMQAGQQYGMAGQGFGADLLARQQQENRAAASFGTGLLGQGQQFGMAGQGFGADLLARQQALEQQRMQFGTGLFGAGSGLFGQYNANVTGALQPYNAYADQVRRLEEQGMGPLEMSAALGGRAMTGGAEAGRYGLYGATAAAKSQQEADKFSPFGDAFSGFGGDATLKDALSKYLRNANSQGPVSMPGYGGMYDTATYMGR